MWHLFWEKAQNARRREKTSLTASGAALICGLRARKLWSISLIPLPETESSALIYGNDKLERLTNRFLGHKLALFHRKFVRDCVTRVFLDNDSTSTHLAGR